MVRTTATRVTLLGVHVSPFVGYIRGLIPRRTYWKTHTLDGRNPAKQLMWQISFYKYPIFHKVLNLYMLIYSNWWRISSINMYHSVNRRCVLSFFTNTSCLFTKTRLVNQSCHHSVFRKLGGHFCEAESETCQVRDVSQLPPQLQEAFSRREFHGPCWCTIPSCQCPTSAILPNCKESPAAVWRSVSGGKNPWETKVRPNLYPEMEVGKLERKLHLEHPPICFHAFMFDFGALSKLLRLPYLFHRFSPLRQWSIWHRSQSHQWRDLRFNSWFTGKWPPGKGAVLKTIITLGCTHLKHQLLEPKLTKIGNQIILKSRSCLEDTLPESWGSVENASLQKPIVEK